MKSNNNTNKEDLPSTKRIETLVDGIFAIAMTLLVLNLNVPQIPYPATNVQILDILTRMAPQFFIYALSFILLASFWRINHSQFNFIEKVDQGIMLITIFWLMLVALVPFSTNLVGDYGYLAVSMIFFHLNLFLIGMFFNFSWYYAVKHNLINKTMDKNFIKNQQIMNLYLPICAIIATGVAFISPEYSSLVYLAIFFRKRFH